MPIVATHKVQHINAGGSSVSTSGNLTAISNKLYIAAVYQKDISVGTVSSLTGGGLGTWVEIGTFVSGNTRMTIFRALNLSPGAAATVTANLSASQTNVTITVEEFDGTKITGTNGADAIVQINGGALSGTSGNVTLSALASVSNAAYGAMGLDAGNTPTGGANFTELHNNAGVGSFQSEWAINQTVVNWTYPSASGIASAIEIAGITGGMLIASEI